jgi:glucosamine--fructose-6-phosphate aminotransferase (isomerizing)
MLGRMRELSSARGKELISELARIPDIVSAFLEKEKEEKNLENIAKAYQGSSNAIYLGRGINYPVALEGALKLKEISYVHAEGYPAAEMKHGPIALIDENMPVVFIATEDPLYSKIVSNIEEVRSRKGRIFAIATEGDEVIKSMVDHVVYLPKCDSLFTPLIASIPLQLFSYYMAVERGCNVDQPRNLAKSVTVE